MTTQSEVLDDRVLTYKVCEAWVEFKVYDTPSSGEEDVPWPVMLEGHIKWDGCSDWDMNTSKCMMHFCGRDDADGLGRLVNRMYDIAQVKLPYIDDRAF